MPPTDKIHTISEITRAVRRLLEGHLGEVWVEGEVSNHRAQASGHQYFTLKDESAQLACVLFRGNARMASARLENGAQVQAFGDLTVYEARGQYQLVVRMVQSRGLGALQAKFEALKAKLAAEGLFDPAIKKPIPAFPHTIAIVTSPTGAALRDILNILCRRAPWVRVLIFPVRVQGKGAEKEIAAAIADLNRASGHSLPAIDAIVLARGGGSIEDLWNFNEEIVARAIHASTIPLVSAVGHEIDFTIADFAADLRAPTPSAAAELVVPERSELETRLHRLAGLMARRVSTTIAHHARVLDLFARGPLLTEPRRVLRESQQQTDNLSDNLNAAVRSALEQIRFRLRDASRLVETRRPFYLVDRYRSDLKTLRSRHLASVTRQIESRAQRLHSAAGMLRALAPQATLERGFSMTLDEDGNAITDASRVTRGQRLHTRLANGEIDSIVETTGADQVG